MCISKAIGSWNEKLQWAIQNMKRKQSPPTLLRVAWKALIYYIWRERNGRMYRQLTETTQHVFEHVKEATCIRLAGIKGVTATQASR